MPQNTPMKRQFTTIDGRTVMSNLPQHWGGNDWTITGVDNPLPVGNYVQTEAGVWIPQKGSDDGAAHVQLTGSNVVQEIFKNAVIPPASSVSLTFNALGSKLGVVLRFTSPTTSRLRYQYIALSSDTAGVADGVVVKDFNNVAIIEPQLIDLQYGRIRLSIDNRSENDATIMFCFVTHFLS